YRPPTKNVGNVAESAAAHRDARVLDRESFIRSLPQVDNPDETIRIGEKRKRSRPEGKTVRGQKASAQRIREEQRENRLQEVGRRRRQDLRNEIDGGARSSRLKEALTPEQLGRMKGLLDR